MLKRVIKAFLPLIGAVSRRLTRDPWLDVTEVSLTVRGLDAAFDGYRIAQFSDLHLDGISTTEQRFCELVETINAQQPDLIAFTGDFITRGFPFHQNNLIVPLSKLRARDVKVAIRGNHDQLLHRGAIHHVIEASGMIDLDNAVYTLRRGDACLHIAGVDSMIRRRARLDLVMAQLPRTDPAILLAHEPDFAFISGAVGRFALQLSGHTHGGQIRLPIITRLALGRIRYSQGWYRVGSMMLYVNRGIGMMALPLRINCRSEVTIITLKASKPPSI